MSVAPGGGRPAGVVVGSLIGTAFGLVFVVANSGGLPSPWPLLIRFAGAAVALGLLAMIVRVGRLPAARATAVPGDAASVGRSAGFADRRYWTVVGLEVAALFGGLSVINRVLEEPEVAVAWVAVVVGVHFVVLARVWQMPLYTVLGGAMVVLGVAGFALRALGASGATVGAVSGVGSGVALFLTVAVALRRSLQTAPAEAAPAAA